MAQVDVRRRRKNRVSEVKTTSTQTTASVKLSASEIVENRRADQLLAVVAVVLAGGLVIDQVREVVSFGRLHTDQDQTLIWEAGRDLLHGHLHEPNFFGEKYNTVFEGLPGALLHVTGVPLGTAIPLGTALLATAAWIALATGAYLRGRRVVALLALAAPLVMRVQYLLLFDAPRGVLAGDLMAAIAVAIAVGSTRYQVRIFSLLAFGGLAILWDDAAALAVVPALTYFVAADWRVIVSRPRPTGFAVAAGAAPPLAWLIFDQSFYRSHPYDLTTVPPSIAVQPHWDVFVRSMHHVGLFLSFFGPALAPEAVVAVTLIGVGLVAVAAFALSCRSLPLLLTVLSLVVLVGLALSVNRATLYRADLYLSGPRLLLPLPIGLWFMAFAAGDAFRERPSTLVTWRPQFGLTLGAVAALSLLVTQVGFSGTATRALAPDLGPKTWVQVVDPAALSRQCATIAQVFRSTHAELLADDDLNQTYGCAALDGLATFAPGLDRRGWVIETSQHTPVRRMLVAVPSCASFPASIGRCTPEEGGVVLLRTPSVPAARTLGRVPGFSVGTAADESRTTVRVER
jgi:hypothetical protein